MPEAILYLIVKRLTYTISSEETITLNQWIGEKPSHLKLFNEVCDIWTASGNDTNKNYDSFSALDKVKQRLLQVNSEKRTSSGILKMWVRVAAAVLLLLTVGTSFYYIGKVKTTIAPRLTEISAPLGSRTRVILPDGTKVWLNGGSTLKYSNTFNLSDRAVSILGEGYFDVTHNKNLPFTVSTSQIRIKVLGTAFNIKAYPDERSVETTLERGSLAIEKIAHNGTLIPQTILEPNQRATYFKTEDQVYLSKVAKKELAKKEETKAEKHASIDEQLLVSKKIDTQIFTSWKDNKLVFRNEPFESLTVKLERWYGVKINIEDEEIKNYHFNGTFEKETVQDVLNIIHYTLPVKYIVEHGVVTITRDNTIIK
jgi:transmembrane sensor